MYCIGQTIITSEYVCEYWRFSASQARRRSKETRPRLQTDVIIDPLSLSVLNSAPRLHSLIIDIRQSEIYQHITSQCFSHSGAQQTACENFIFRPTNQLPFSNDESIVSYCRRSMNVKM